MTDATPKTPELVQKAGVQSGESPTTFILSSASVDRMGDIVDPGGVTNLEYAEKNMPLLFGHDSSKIVGGWKNLRRKGTQILGDIVFARPGTSPLVDEVRALVEQGFLKAVSIGFRPLEAERRKDGDGYHFKKWEILETSLVAIPANPDALAVVRSLEVRDLVFLGQSSADEETLDCQSGKAVSGATTLSETVLRANRAVIGARRALK